MSSDIFNALIDKYRKYLDDKKKDGVKYVFQKKSHTIKSADAAVNISNQHDPVVESDSPVCSSESQVLTKADRLQKLWENIKDCPRCAQLAGTRRQVVFGDGNPHARIMFVGEAPGHDEDVQGKPFVGKAGQLLTKMIRSIGIDRDDVYIANILKCRPPGNRNPSADEVANCREYLARQIDIIQPELICTLGAVAAQTLLQTDEPISKLRGKITPWNETVVMPTFHPSYLLRNPVMKKNAWRDLLLIRDTLN